MLFNARSNCVQNDLNAVLTIATGKTRLTIVDYQLLDHEKNK